MDNIRKNINSSYPTNFYMFFFKKCVFVNEFLYYMEVMIRTKGVCYVPLQMLSLTAKCYKCIHGIQYMPTHLPTQTMHGQLPYLLLEFLLKSQPLRLLLLLFLTSSRTSGSLRYQHNIWIVVILGLQ